MKNLIIILTAFLFTGMFYSCEKEFDSIKDIEPEDQEIEIIVRYSGTAHALLREEYELTIGLYDENWEHIRNYEMDVNDEYMRDSDGFIYEPYYKLEPGIYYLCGVWNWMNSSVFESCTCPDPRIPDTKFVVDGFEKVSVEVELIDQTKPTDKSWAEGSISYNGNIVDYAPIMIAMMDKDFNVIAEDCRTTAGHNFSSGDRQYCGPKVPNDGIYNIFAYWDLNWNEKYDGGEPRAYYQGHAYFSPGLPMCGCDIELTLNN